MTNKETPLNNVIESLTEYYPQLKDKDYTTQLKKQCLDLFLDTGNTQSDYESLRNKVEKYINNFNIH